ncbi:MAG: 23S rRNA (pseudouridine(1915)-N(3))-methyltransferase RlmH [Ruminiclostridium sp.]|nr:23S rRNA (pseudouridine(1915)-N(3))-methyltransferase RlmH [Ruminiclostridium sp.]MBQ8932643.1 23S rRNA (pseudouridine(1915)-N(3))-methyltransferase RlmH [Ruminiclostridium sp.]
MLNINIICLGRLKEDYLRAACKEYEKRLGTMCKLTISELEPIALPQNPSDKQIENALSKEAEMIEGKMLKNAVTYAMCIEGKQRSSEELAQEFSDIAVGGRSAVNFIIGSSFGLAPEIKAKADYRLSMSKMTFPHQLARVMLLEQIYRAHSINAGSKYHK